MDNKNWYDKSYKILLFIPVILVLISIIYLFSFTIKNGDIIYKDVSLTGGTTITLLDSQISVSDLKSQFPDSSIRAISDIRTGNQLGIIIETVETAEEFTPKLESFIGYKLDLENSSVEFSGSSLSQGFYQQLRIAILIAFVLMAITVFIIFRTPVPSLAVIFAAFSDIVLTITAINLFGVQVSVAGIVAFLMLIGYSVDTDILLTTRVVKNHEGSVNERIYGAFKTGVTMTLSAIAAVGVAFIVIYDLSDTLRQIFGILLIGLTFDLFSTWFTNASILKWYMVDKK
jgi:preprotein translocase subunit SecF